MSSENFILKAWNEQRYVFLTNLHAIQKRPVKNAIHDLRVSIKKIRSYLRLKENMNVEPWIESFTPVKFFFKTSGIQRDFEMSYFLLSTYLRNENLELPAFKKYLQLNKSMTRQWTKKSALEFNEEIMQILNEKIHSLFAEYSDEILVLKIKEITDELLQKTNILATNLKKNVHEIRKKLKDVYYWLIIIPNNENYKSLINFLEKTLHVLGNWQDNFVFLKKIKSFRKNYLINNSIESETVKILETEIRKRKTELLNKVKKNLESRFKHKRKKQIL